MRFVYEYRTSDNAKHSGEICAADREAAYAKLKRQGIKPSRFAEAPGLANKVLGKGKRWIAIGVLAVIAVVATVLALGTRREIKRITAEPPLPRHQIAHLPKDWARSINAIFEGELDRLLAAHSQPGVKIDPTSVDGRPVQGEWVATMRRVVAGMREEAQGFLALGKTMRDLELFLDERQQMEHDYREQTLKKYKSNVLDKGEANAILTAMSLEPIK